MAAATYSQTRSHSRPDHLVIVEDPRRSLALGKTDNRHWDDTQQFRTQVSPTDGRATLSAMFVLNGLLWIVSLPFRLIVWMVGLALWIVALPFRIVWSILSFFGIGRLLTFATLGIAGYALYRLVNDEDEPAPVAPPLDRTPKSPAQTPSVPNAEGDVAAKS